MFTEVNEELHSLIIFQFGDVGQNRAAINTRWVRAVTSLSLHAQCGQVCTEHGRDYSDQG